MADSAASFLLDNLSQLLAREANLLYGVENRVRSLRSELQMIDAFLKDSEGKQSGKEIDQVVIDQIRDAAYEAEDVIDTFITKNTMHKRRSKLGRMLHGVGNVKLRHDVAEKIDSIKATIIDIRDNKIKYDDFFQQESESSSAREEEERVRLLHKRRRNVEEDDVVGFVRHSKEVIKRLMEEDSRSNVVSIIGMGGLGKTTLARKVYNSNEVKEYFDHRAWVYVSNECRVKELLLGLLKCLGPNLQYERGSKMKGKKQKGREEPRDLSSLDEDELKQKVQESLKRKRYLLVLDDLWKTEDWDEVQDAFPRDNEGSKILITSRSKEVASHTCREYFSYNLQFLNDEESWELFSKRVFWGEECPFDLEVLGKQIVKRCRGLPLSIIVLAGLLANKEKSHREWSKVVGHVNWYLTQDETQVKDIVLKLSYDNLPRRLKPCFLYLGIFPEDSEILVRPLLQRWIAEGFIQEPRAKYLEDVAEDYLYELINRSLVQVVQVKSTGEGVKTCRIHDLLRDLCISKSKGDNFFEVCTDYNTRVKTRPRRLSVHCRMDHYVYSSNYDHSCVRSLLCFDPGYYFTPNQWKRLFKCFKLVRVLDLGNNQEIKIPSNFGLLIHLRYLRIHSKYIKFVPDSICTLPNLQTLDIAGPDKLVILISFPSGIWKLKQLQHVYTRGPIMLRGHSRSKSDDEVMSNLETISSIALNKQTAYLFEKVKFPKLRKLGLQISPARKGKLCKLLRSLQQLRGLNKLGVSLKLKKFKGPIPSDLKYLEWHFGCKPQELLQSLQQLTLLSTLKIYDALDLPTCDVALPRNLTKLVLEGISCMNDDGKNALGNLTQLRILKLCGSFRFASFGLNCIAGGFPQLQEFVMKELKVHSWRLANGAMPCLQRLVIQECDCLDGLPNELWSLTALRQVRVLNPTEALSGMLVHLEMKDGCELTIM